MLSDKSSQAILHNSLVKHATSSENTPQIRLTCRTNDPTSSFVTLTPSRSDHTMDQIKAYMLERNLRPGAPLPTETQLCTQLGVSRSSVREALRKLEALDIVESHRGSGTFVGKMTLEPLVQTLMLRTALDTSEGGVITANITQIRVALDLGVANQVVSTMEGTQNPHIRAIVTAMMEKLDRGQLFPDEDIAFHSAMLAYLNNEVIVELMHSMWFVHQTILPRLNLRDLENVTNLATTARSHGEMLDAAEAGDLDAYIDAVHRHYHPLQRLLDAL